MMKLLRSLLALLAIAVLLVGVPVALVTLAPPAMVLDRDWLAVLAAPDDGSVLLVVLALVGWIAWLMLALSLLTEAIAVLTRGRWRPSIGPVKWMRPVSAALVGAAIGGWLLTAAPAGVDLGGSPASISQSDGSTGVDEATSSVVRHQVEAGDDLWTLAERYYGDGTQWRKIVETNPSVGPERELRPGSVLKLKDTVPLDDPAPADPAPADSATADSAPADSESPVGGRHLSDQTVTAAPDVVVVRDGDSLYGIAARHLGDGARWPELVAANADLIRDPDVIRTGWRLTLPVVTGGEAGGEQSSAQQVPVAVVREAASVELTSDRTPSGSDVEAGSEADQSQVLSTRAEHSDSEPSDSDPSEPTSIEPTSIEPAEGSVSTQDLVANEEASAESLAALAALGVGVTLAGVVTTQWRRRRQLQLQQRRLGRRLPQPTPASAEFEGALNYLSAQAQLPTDPAAATVVLGPGKGGSDLLFDLSTVQVLGLEGEPDEVTGVLGSFATCLASADWSTGISLTVVGADLAWVKALDHPGLRQVDDLAAVLPHWLNAAQARRSAREELACDELASDDLAGPADRLDLSLIADNVVEPEILLVSSAPTDEQWAALSATAPGMTVVCPSSAEHRDRCTQVIRIGRDVAHLGTTSFIAQRINEPAKRALIELGETSRTTGTMPAPWWASGPPDGISTIHNTPDVPRPTEGGKEMSATISTSTGHPFLLVMGAVDLVQTRGETPLRASRQCAEYCAWLLRNPGRTAATMSEALLVAEGTRRSNMSRLRNWLGFAEDGDLYLPEAYTGRISLDPRISSDWEQVQQLIEAGVNLTHNQGLVDALHWVRGEPFADAAPTQWHWAEEWRTDMVSTVRDIALVLAERCLTASDPATARWAIQRGLLANPDDEFLLATMVRIESQAGNVAAAERLVQAMTRRARNAGVDLLPETVQVMQVALEGRPRSQRA